MIFASAKLMFKMKFMKLFGFIQKHMQFPKRDHLDGLM